MREYVEVIGSSSVLGLLAKPIIGLAFGLTVDQPLPLTQTKLENDGWIYRGDAGADGGHVFVFELEQGGGWPTCTWSLTKVMRGGAI